MPREEKYCGMKEKGKDSVERSMSGQSKTGLIRRGLR
jgi:hypothetical protein